jgi:hypothetical protein
MTGSPPNDSLGKIVVLDVGAAVTAEGMATFVLGEQLHCIGCGRVSTRWQIPAPSTVPGPRLPADRERGNRPEPGS